MDVLQNIKNKKNFRIKKNKGVSPLIATVLLIAFAMALAAVLSGWLSSFTNSQKEKNTVFENTIQCNNANIQNDYDFSQYDEANGLFKTRLKNIGTENFFLGNYMAWYDGVPTPAVWIIDNPKNVSVEKQNDRILSVNVSGGKLNKIKFTGYRCEGVTAVVSRPAGGWQAGALSSLGSIFVTSKKSA